MLKIFANKIHPLEYKRTQLVIANKTNQQRIGRRKLLRVLWDDVGSQLVKGMTIQNVFLQQERILWIDLLWGGMLVQPKYIGELL